jgi:hypothetical protein
VCEGTGLTQLFGSQSICWDAKLHFCSIVEMTEGTNFVSSIVRSCFKIAAVADVWKLSWMRSTLKLLTHQRLVRL